MYVDVGALDALAKLLGTLTILGGAAWTAYKFLARDKQQIQTIRDIQEEQTLLCYGIRACLQGLAEQGCDGPVHDALERLDKHLNKKAHREMME